MRVYFASIPSFSLLLLAIAVSGCNTPTTSDDAGTGGDSGPVDAGRDTGTDTGVMRDVGVDAGPRPLCEGTGCNVVELALMGSTSCARRQNGQIDCWGRGQEGQLGDGAMRHSDDCRQPGETSVDCSRAGVTVSLPASDAPVRMAANGSIANCATLTSGQVWCWGQQTFQLGATTEHPRWAPEHLATDGTPIADGTPGLSQSFSTMCWIMPDSSARCIGRGSAGRLGDGTFNDAMTPVTVLRPDGMGPLMGVLEIDTQGGHSCARTADAIYCWGSNQFGELGAPAPHQTCMNPPTVFDCTSTPIQATMIDATHVVAMELGGSYTCVLRDDHHVQCWGGGQTGGLGNGSLAASPDPIEPMGITDAVELHVGGGTTCVRRMDNTIWCWGASDTFQIADGRMTHDAGVCMDGNGSLYDCQLLPVQIMGITDATLFAMSGEHACALRASGEVWCWGSALRYQLGNQSRNMVYAPVMVTGL